MTISSTHSEMLGQRLPDEDEQGSANQLRQILASQMSEGTDEVNHQILVDDKPTTIAKLILDYVEKYEMVSRREIDELL